MHDIILKYKVKYKSLEDTLEALVIQAMLSVNYCAAMWGSDNNLKQIWTIVSQNTTYKHDPKGVELIQSVPTLIDNNFHGIPGAGDCDCFSVFFIAMLIANGYHPDQIYIVLQGRTENIPTHIYIMCNGVNLDATEAHYNSIRNYPYIQFVSLSKFVIIK